MEKLPIKKRILLRAKNKETCWEQDTIIIQRYFDFDVENFINGELKSVGKKPGIFYYRFHRPYGNNIRRVAMTLTLESFNNMLKHQTILNHERKN